MNKIRFILLALICAGLLQRDVSARRTPNQMAEFVKKREQIKSGTLTYRYRHLPYDESDTQDNTITVRFFDVKRGPYNYIYTAVIAEDLYGNVLIYDFDSTYKFATHLKRKKVSPHKNFNHEERYFYEPFAQYNGMLNLVTQDSTYHPVIRDSAYGKSTFQIITSKKYSDNRYIFDAGTSVPIFYSQVWHEQYKEYTLLNYKLNNFDSASFFRMIADSIKGLLVSCPNTIDQTSLYDMDPLKDTMAPDFTYKSFTGDTIQLSKVLEKNKVVIIDFWFRGYLDDKRNHKAVPVLTSMYDKYKARGLEILSLNPYDRRRTLLDSTITEHRVTYPVLLANNTAVRKYRINGYPCIFVISKGKIVATLDRKSTDIEGSLTAILEKYLGD